MMKHSADTPNTQTQSGDSAACSAVSEQLHMVNARGNQLELERHLEWEYK